MYRLLIDRSILKVYCQMDLMVHQEFDLVSQLLYRHLNRRL